MTNEELIADATKVAAFMLDPDETTGMNKCGALIGQLIDALRAAEAREQKLRVLLSDIGRGLIDVEVSTRQRGDQSGRPSSRLGPLPRCGR